MSDGRASLAQRLARAAHDADRPHDDTYEMCLCEDKCSLATAQAVVAALAEACGVALARPTDNDLWAVVCRWGSPHTHGQNELDVCEGKPTAAALASADESDCGPHRAVRYVPVPEPAP